MKVGSRVKYNDINLSDKGKIVALGRGKHGGDCRVQWDRYPNFTTEECLFNLKEIESESSS